jgi:hypothetical protein
MWNNRIVKHEKDDTVWYAVHEVFYNENGGINGYTENPITIVGDTVEDVKSQLEMIAKDIEKHEVIDASTVKFEDWWSEDGLDWIADIEDEVKMDKTKFEIRKLHDEK